MFFRIPFHNENFQIHFAIKSQPHPNQSHTTNAPREDYQLKEQCFCVSRLKGSISATGRDESRSLVKTGA